MHADNLTIGVVGLGLIGGSIAQAFRENTTYRVLGSDKSEKVLSSAVFCSAVEESLEGKLAECDILIVALYPKDTVEFIKKHAGEFKPGTIVTDTSGVKSFVCEELFKLSEEGGFYFIGGHPMAGIERSGFEYSRPDLFKDASLILTPYKSTPKEKTDLLWHVLRRLGFSYLELTTPKEHDKMIAFTSQLAHIVSSAYVMSPSALNHFGFSAGSFKDMTRVARLNEYMWTELFLENASCLSLELDGLIKRLLEFDDALKTGDKKHLFELLKKGREQKEESDLLGG